MENNVENLLKLHNLPSRDLIFNELGQINVDEDTDLIQLLLEKLSDKVSIYIKFLEDILQPNSDICAMNEAAIFSDTERKDLYNILRTLLYWERLSLKVNLSGNENEKIEYFNNYFKFWQENKNKLSPFLDKAINVWKESSEEAKTEGYFG